MFCSTRKGKEQNREGWARQYVEAMVEARQYVMGCYF